MPVRAAEEPGLAGPANWYGGPVAGARLAGRLGFALLEPTDGWLADEVAGRLDRLDRALACPSGHVSGLVFWPPERDLSADEVVEQALAYRPIVL